MSYYVASRSSVLGPEDPFAHERHTDELIAEAIIQDERPLSNCCGGPFHENTDFCQECGEHASAEIVDFTFPDSQTVFMITYDPVTKVVVSFEETPDYKRKGDQ